MTKKELMKYEHIPLSIHCKKDKIPTTNFTYSDLDEFNDIYKYCYNNYKRVELTEHGSIANSIEYRYTYRYMVSRHNDRYELILICGEGQYRFVVQARQKKQSPISGMKAAREVINVAKKFKIDLTKYSCGPDLGFKLKNDIKSPIIACDPKFIGLFTGKGKGPFDKLMSGKIHHLDLNSSYASRIVEAHPELKEMYEYMYSKRKENDNYYKHVLTNSIGCFQSEFCPSLVKGKFKNPYGLTCLARDAVNGTVNKLLEIAKDMMSKGIYPILYNTDGIFYYNPNGNHEPYHTNEEGTELGQYKNDHTYLDLAILSKGAYQYIENGVCHTVVRGITKFDSIKPDRETWEYGDVFQANEIKQFEFIEGTGIVGIYEEYMEEDNV